MYPSDLSAVRTRNEEFQKKQAVQARPINLKAAFKYEIYDKTGHRFKFEDLFIHSEYFLGHRMLFIFIRHFFCGNCQEYLLRLASHPSFQPASLAKHNLELVIIGCGAPSLIDSYRELVGLPEQWHLYADPSAELYRVFGMHRSFSLGDRSPKYIQRSLAGNMFRSVAQGLKRLSRGDILAAGRWDVNGGEFLFELIDGAHTAKPSAGVWKLTWHHRMFNSRDHTEVDDLSTVLGLPSVAETADSQHHAQSHARTQSSPVVFEFGSLLDEKIEATTLKTPKSGLRKSLSIGRQSRMHKKNQPDRPKNARAGKSFTL